MEKPLVPNTCSILNTYLSVKTTQVLKYRGKEKDGFSAVYKAFKRVF